MPNPAPSTPPTPPLQLRLDWLRRFRRLLAGSELELSLACERDLQKPRHEALFGDLLPVLAACSWLERHAPRLLAPTPLTGGQWWQLGQRGTITREPLGHIAIIATWNYPLGLLGVQLIHAITAGNRVTVKPSEHAPRSQGLLLDLADEALSRSRLPAATLARTPATREAGAELLANHTFDHVVFTGSTAVGQNIAEKLATTLTPSTLELSGCDSALVLEDADPILAAHSIWMGLTMNAGQTCMAPRRVIVHHRVHDALLAELEKLAATSEARPLITPQAAAQVRTLVADAVTHGGRILARVPLGNEGVYLRPLLVADCPPIAALVQGEHFGPALAILKATSTEHALLVHSAIPKKLATSLFTRDHRTARALAPRLGSNVVTLNDIVLPTAQPALSITGVGPSGWNPSRGEAGLLAMTRPLCITTTSTRIRPSITPPTGKTLDQLAKIIRWWYGGEARSMSPVPQDSANGPLPFPQTRP